VREAHTEQGEVTMASKAIARKLSLLNLFLPVDMDSKNYLEFQIKAFFFGQIKALILFESLSSSQIIVGKKNVFNPPPKDLLDVQKVKTSRFSGSKFRILGKLNPLSRNH
jgi:hypothetical protein